MHWKYIGLRMELINQDIQIFGYSDNNDKRKDRSRKTEDRRSSKLKARSSKEERKPETDEID